VTLDPTAKRGRRLVELRIDGEPVDPEETYSVATFRRPGDPERDLGNCGFPFRDVEDDDDTIPVDVIVEYLEEHSPVDYEVMGLVETAEDGGRVQNTRRRAVSVYPARRRLRGRRGVLRDVHDTAQEHVSRCRA